MDYITVFITKLDIKIYSKEAFFSNVALPPIGGRLAVTRVLSSLTSIDCFRLGNTYPFKLYLQ